VWITEEEVVDALPPDGWLRRYVIHAYKQTTSPLVYHYGVGLSLLAVTTPTAYGMFYAGVLRSNQFVLLLGRSGEDQKSSAVNVGQDLLDKVGPELKGDYFGSAEGIVASLSRKGTQFVPISEFGKFLASAQGGYFEQTKTLLADLWDARAVERVKADKKDQAVVVRAQHPRLSIAAACSISYLEKHTLAEDWTGGFMGRWLVLLGRRERTDPDPVGDDSDTQWLVDELRRRALITHGGWCTGLTPRARELWNHWFHDISNDRPLPHNIIGIRARAPTHARKIALALAWDYGPAQAGKNWEMDLDVLEPAIRLTELHVRSLVSLSTTIAEHPEARMRRSVLMAVDQFGGVATLGQVLSILKMRKRAVVEHLDALVEEGIVRKVATTLGALTYELTAPGTSGL
jgi:hypothetical protein